MTERRRVTTVAPVKPDAQRSLGELHAAGNHPLSVGRLSTTQCARLVLLDAPGGPHGQPIGPQHRYVSDTDARAERHLVEPSLDFLDGINQLFEGCERYEFEQLIERRR
jgi:hypothetical protein